MFFGGCPGKCATFVHENACLLPVLHAVKVALAVFYQQKNIFTGIYLYNPLYEGPGKMLAYLFLRCGSIAALAMP